MNKSLRQAGQNGLPGFLRKWNQAMMALLLWMGLAVAAHAQTVANPGFETGSLSSWICSTTVAWSGTDAHSGTGCCVITTHGTALQTITGLTPNTTYTLVGWAKVGTAAKAWVSVNAYGGAQIITTITSTTYQQAVINFTTGSTNTSAQISVANPTTSGTVFGDDFAIGFKPASDPGNTGNWLANATYTDEFNGTTLDSTKWHPYSYWSGRSPSQFDPANVSVSGGLLHLLTTNENMLVNGNLETGDFTGWTNVGGGATITTLSSTSEASNYYHGAKLSTPGSDIEQTIDVLPNTVYHLTADMRVATGGTTPKVTLGVRSPASFASVSTTAWTYQTQLEFTTGPSQTTATVYVSNDGGAGSVVYADEIIFVPKTLPSGLHFAKSCYLTAGVINSTNTTAIPYGYYETRMKVADAASSSAFWFKAEVPFSAHTEEIDVAEQIGNPFYYTTVETMMRINTWYWPNSTTAYINGNPAGVGDIGVHLAAAFHVFGVDWEADQMRFYCDGTLVRTIPQVQLPSAPTATGQTQVTTIKTLFFDTEVFANYGIPVDDSTSDFQVDYVRAWTH